MRSMKLLWLTVLTIGLAACPVTKTEIEDSGKVVTDSGAMIIDSGQMVTDSGGMIVDSGQVVTDSGGMIVDSGQVATDSGNVVVDSGQMATDSGGMIVDSGTLPNTDSGQETSCTTYPSDASFDMALNGTLGRYQWPEAIDGLGQNSPLDMQAVHCDNDENRDWAAFDKILFVSVPVW